jgi:hypothetical protein|tara:strand:+ start:3253 stop:3363 length:111 start_codon:yes stop_codon:yes gene_type:complete
MNIDAFNKQQAEEQRQRKLDEKKHKKANNSNQDYQG